MSACVVWASSGVCFQFIIWCVHHLVVTVSCVLIKFNWIAQRTVWIARYQKIVRSYKVCKKKYSQEQRKSKVWEKTRWRQKNRQQKTSIIVNDVGLSCFTYDYVPLEFRYISWKSNTKRHESIDNNAQNQIRIVSYVTKKVKRKRERKGTC